MKIGRLLCEDNKLNDLVVHFKHVIEYLILHVTGTAERREQRDSAEYGGKLKCRCVVTTRRATRVLVVWRRNVLDFTLSAWGFGPGGCQA